MTIIKKTKTILACAILAMNLWLIGLTGSSAGQLFPPDGGTAPSCGPTQVLRWMDGMVRCAEVTPLINTAACEQGKHMTQITGGQPICTTAGQFGGMFSVTGGGACYRGNPLTGGACNCPNTFHQVEVAYGSHNQPGDTMIYQCVK